MINALYNKESYEIVKLLIEKYNLSHDEILEGGSYGDTSLWYTQYCKDPNTVKFIVDKANITIADIENAVGECGDELLQTLYVGGQYDILDIIADKINELCVDIDDLHKLYNNDVMCNLSYEYIKSRRLL